MRTAMCVIILFVMSLWSAGCWRKVSNRRGEARFCHSFKCDEEKFNCRCEDSEWSKQRGECIPPAWLCDGRKDCENNADELECVCPPEHFQCGSARRGEVMYWTDQYNCIPIELVGDGRPDCFNWRDELGVTRGCTDVANYQCDGVVNCPDAAEEKGCDGCPSDRPNRCACNKPGDDFSCTGTRGLTCYSDHHKCNNRIDCVDGSDEEGCKCMDDQFTCQCYRNRPISCKYNRKGCIPMSKYRDGYGDCTHGSDEQQYLKRTKCDNCDVTVRRLDLTGQCEDYADCDKKTCAAVSALNCTGNSACNATDIICTSHCNMTTMPQSCDAIFQCENGYLEIAHNFCDGKIDCPDGSDEIRNQPGFKCSASFERCVLPQRNLHDNVAQCKDESDLSSEVPFFQCFDGKLNISELHLCDGVIDCFDLSDECLCQMHFHKPVCQEIFVLNDPYELACGNLNPQCHEIKPSSIEIAQCTGHPTFNRSNISTSYSLMSIHCETKYGKITAVMCDGRPECKNLEDECSCDNPPEFCKDSCHDQYPLGDRYCDGVVDQAWKYINHSSCPEGFDEKYCPKRFSCKAKNLVNIDDILVCDGIKNCDDGSDEYMCKRNSVFSSDSEMIENLALRTSFWVMAVLVIFGNIFVIFSTTSLLCKRNLTDSQKFNHILILNLSLSDLFMGLYLLIVSIKSVEYSGYYGEVDYQWRTSFECSIIGSLAVISSETSCFIMTIITAFRLYNVFNPFAARTASTLKWKLGIVLAWSVSLMLALFPIFKWTSPYFVRKIWFSNKFLSNEVWNKTQVITFSCRLASLTNRSIKTNGDAWESTLVFLNKHFPKYSVKGEFGYYGETSVCMPRIYVNFDDSAWIFSLVFITFNLISFLFVAISYIIFYFEASFRGIRSSKSDRQGTEMQKRIARLIVTDFACWVPVCLMVYINISGVRIPQVVYIVTAGLLLPINSALNPLLYSGIVEKYLKQIFFQKKRKPRKEVQLRSLN